LGCVEEDPFPTKPGVFLGSGVTPDNCIAGGYTDADQDGLGDFCEEQLSYAFRPELYYSSGDNVGREPYWVARALDEDRVRIGFLLSYYRDEGCPAWVCSWPTWPNDPSSWGHNGDSEGIYVDVYYHWTWKHWVLDNVLLSRHSELFAHPRGNDPYPTQFYYPGGKGDYPRVYVSEGKHANYATLSGCNGGGQAGTDTCANANTAARVEWNSVWNLGSAAVRLRDCVVSRNPSYEYYGSGYQECYWTATLDTLFGTPVWVAPKFRGWIPPSVGGMEADVYRNQLEAAGF
jgi:hypothetical protein